jgi:hypothetical protein
MTEDIGALGAQAFGDGCHFVELREVVGPRAIHIGDDETVILLTETTENGFS